MLTHHQHCASCAALCENLTGGPLTLSPSWKKTWANCSSCQWISEYSSSHWIGTSSGELLFMARLYATFRPHSQARLQSQLCCHIRPLWEIGWFAHKSMYLLTAFPATIAVNIGTVLRLCWFYITPRLA